MTTAAGQRSRIIHPDEDISLVRIIVYRNFSYPCIHAYICEFFNTYFEKKMKRMKNIIYFGMIYVVIDNHLTPAPCCRVAA